MKINDILIVDTIKQDAFGRGIAKYNNFVIFVNNALPNEQLKIIIKKLKKNYAEANIVEIIKPSNSRRTYECIYYDKCGGCNIGHQCYGDQIQYKKNKVKELLNVKNIDIIKTNELNYRNKIVLRIKDKKVGLYEKLSNSVVEIDNCKISNNKINNIITKINDFKYIEYVNEITIRALDETMISFITNRNINKEIIEYF
ncbi:MAG: TRAM domain-containing protein, partial [Tenericutes bacterium]|nr:TRAM domain-containing protein [Mycoplasmatota bacterium]